MSRRLLLIRYSGDQKQSLGCLYLYSETGRELFRCKTVERSWAENKRNESCVPEGTYPLRLEYSPRFGEMLWELHQVPNRSEIKIHVSNFFYQLNGCIAVGDMHLHIDGDNHPDVRNSRKTLNRLHVAMKPFTEATLKIISL